MTGLRRGRTGGVISFMRALGPALAADDLVPVGAWRRNWRATLMSDGFVIVRHPDLQRTVEMADAVGETHQMYAG